MAQINPLELWISWSPKPHPFQELQPFTWWCATAEILIDVFRCQEYNAVPGCGSLLHWHILAVITDPISWGRKQWILKRYGNCKISRVTDVEGLWPYMEKNLGESVPVIGIDDPWITHITSKRWIRDQYRRWGYPTPKKRLDLSDYMFLQKKQPCVKSYKPFMGPMRP